jgi:hypothetical protein
VQVFQRGFRMDVFVNSQPCLSCENLDLAVHCHMLSQNGWVGFTASQNRSVLLKEYVLQFLVLSLVAVAYPPHLLVCGLG